MRRKYLQTNLQIFAIQQRGSIWNKKELSKVNSKKKIKQQKSNSIRNGPKA